MANAKFGRNQAGKRAPSNANQKARTKANKERNIQKDAAMKKAHAEKKQAVKLSPSIEFNGLNGHATPAQAKHNLRMWKRSKRSHAQQPKHNHRFDNTIACRMLHQQTDLPCDASNFHKVIENVQFAINAKH